MIKTGSLVRYNSRLLLVLGQHPDEYGYADGWWRCAEIGTNRVRIYCPEQLAIVKSEKEFYL
jgi:hypothetical protein